jgi:hypothetical protein
MSIGAAKPQPVFGQIWDFNELGHLLGMVEANVVNKT